MPTPRYGHATPSRVVKPFACPIAAYERLVYTYGPLFGLIMIAGLGGVIRVRRRPPGLAWSRRGSSMLPWATAVVLLVFPIAIADFDYRYLVPVLPFAGLAGRAVLRVGRGGRWQTGRMDGPAGGELPRRVVLVEGLSDSGALHALAARGGHDLPAEGIAVVSMGGATNIGHFLGRFGPGGLGLPVAGLCDAGEEAGFRRGLQRAGLGSDLARAGFFVCVADLEDELIRALGVACVQDVVAAQGELGSFRTFCKQPAQRSRTTAEQLRRFMGTRSGRKIHYGRVLAGALDPARVPEPLDRLLAHVLS